MSEIFAITNKGMVRENNEDCYMVNGHVANDGELYITDVDRFIVSLADGMGGTNGGEIASSMVLESLAEIDIYNKELDMGKYLKQINQKVIDYSIENKEFRDMGSTVVGLIYNDEGNSIFNLGDSRLYLYRRGYIRQITKDHSIVQSLHDAGKISRDGQSKHQLSHILTQCMGASRNNAIEPEIIKDMIFAEGDLIILSSDGLYSKFDDDTFEEILKTDMGLSELGKYLIAEANARGGDDNITLILIRISCK